MPPIDCVAILGVGLIGGSLGLAWRRSGLVQQVIGAGRNPETLAEALRVGAVDRVTTDFRAAVAGADLVVLCAPISTIIAWAPELGPHCKPGAVVTDVGSTKRAITEAWHEHLPPTCSFIGGHPMAGAEKGGIGAARADLCQGAPYLLFPGARTSDYAYAVMSRLAAATGARVVTMPDGEALHDSQVAYISHLPQVVAVALAGAAMEMEDRQEGTIALSGGGFRDTTRIAASPPDIWVDIFATNQERVLQAVRDFRASLGNLEAALEQGDWEEVTRLFQRAAAARAKLPPR